MTRAVVRPGGNHPDRQAGLLHTAWVGKLMNSRAFKLLHLSGKLSVMLKALLCACLASIALLSIVQTQRIQDNLAKHRLLALSTQDLILQSHALHYIADNRPSQSQMFLEHRGYKKPAELLVQLNTRLSILEVAQGPETLKIWLTGLRQELNVLILEHANGTSPSHQQAPLIRDTIDQWFTQLYGLNRAIQNENPEENHKYLQLQEQNDLLGILVIGLCALIMLISWWPHSRFGQQVRKTIEELRSHTQIDPLTGALNRLGWIEQLAHLLRNRSHHDDTPIGCIAMLSIDYFRQYIDTFGLEAANVRLRDFAESLRLNCRPQDLIARISGEEFAIFLSDCTPAQAHHVINRIRYSEFAPIATFSAGIIEVTELQNIPHLMATADQALYQAQQNGRNQGFSAAA